MSNLKIPYETEDFPPGTIPNGSEKLPVTWDDILWAAVTVGRPNRHYVFRHGTSSVYEALFRWSLVRMALEQNFLGGRRVKRTNAAKTLDPTEKGAVNYFLGMTFCKLFADKLLNTPWLLHLDVWRRDLDAELKSRSRPDLVGMDRVTGKWHAFECKGRISPPANSAKEKAKDQALRLVSVGGKQCSLHVGAITYFVDDSLYFYWRDPIPEKGHQIEVPYSEDVWEYYYRPVLNLIRLDHEKFDRMREEPLMVDVERADLRVGIHPKVLSAILDEKWGYVLDFGSQLHGKMKYQYQADGIAIIAGDSWKYPFSNIHEGDWSH
jgi:hypothetical protein